MAKITAGPWECFHCGDVFYARADAAQHFGAEEHAKPACLVLGSDNTLLKALRQAEQAAADAMHQLATESMDVHRAYAAMQSRHAMALLAAEESGYAKGMRDVRGQVDRDGCPHCGATGHRDIRHEVNSKEKVHPYRVVCGKCGCGTAWHGSWEGAVKSWQTRAGIPAETPSAEPAPQQQPPVEPDPRAYSRYVRNALITASKRKDGKWYLQPVRLSGTVRALLKKQGWLEGGGVRLTKAGERARAMLVG